MPRQTPPRRPSSQRPPAPSGKADAPGDRLQKVLAAAGLGSRRQCEELILAGRVEVDRRVVTELGTRADPGHQEIRVDGVPLPKPKRSYYAIHKPPGVVSTNRDPAGRPRVIDLVPGDEGLFTVGRLDMSSEGLILVTNDGDLANRLTHPRYGVAKTYEVEVAGQLSPETLRQLHQGIYLAEAFVRAADARIKRRSKKSTLLEIVLREGRNREIRRMLARLGHKVLRLKRVAMGPLRLGEMASGTYRQLHPGEVQALRAATEPGQAAARHPAARRKKSAPSRPAKKAGPRAKTAGTGAQGRGRARVSESGGGGRRKQARAAKPGPRKKPAQNKGRR